MTNKTIFALTLGSLLLGSTLTVLAQAGGGPIQPAAVPVDSALGLLAMAGVAFGAKSLKKK